MSQVIDVEDAEPGLKKQENVAERGQILRLPDDVLITLLPEGRITIIDPNAPEELKG